MCVECLGAHKLGAPKVLALHLTASALTFFKRIGVWLSGYAGTLGAAVLASLLAVFGVLVFTKSVGLFEAETGLIKRPAELLPR